MKWKQTKNNVLINVVIESEEFISPNICIYIYIIKELKIELF